MAPTAGLPWTFLPIPAPPNWSQQPPQNWRRRRCATSSAWLTVRLADSASMVTETREVKGLTDFRERRGRPRVEQPFPVTVRGVDATGEPLDIDTVLDNMSAGGLYVRIPRRIEPGARLAVGIRLSVPGGQGRKARVAARGVVLRADSTAHGEHGLAIEFTRHRVF